MRWCFIPILILLLIGCDVPSARPEKHPTLVIATDHLAKEDSLFFEKFALKFHVNIELKEIDADSLIQMFQNDPYGLGIDVVFIHQLYDMRLVRNAKLLEPLHLDSFPQEATLNGTDAFIKVGIDPFICLSRKNTAINVYDDLHNHSYFLNLDHKSKTHFFAPFEKRMHRSKTFERVQKMHESTVPMNSWMVDSSDAILTTYSMYRNRSPQDSLWNTFEKVNFPNSSTSGVFHDALSVGIVCQSSNYLMASKLLFWLTDSKINQEFVANRGYDPMRSTGEYRRFGTSPEALMQYHTMIERMFEELP